MLTVFAVEHKIRFVRYTGKQRVVWFCVLAVLTAGGFGYLQSQSILSTGKNGGFFWNLTSSYEKYGYFLATHIYENYQKVEKPEGYSAEAVEQLMTELIQEQTERSGQNDSTGQLPNIIAIMNESFTDFASVGGIQTSKQLLPFIDSLQENTVKGNLYVPVFGGGTANTEFEFLTGSTMQFLPTGSTPYQAYVKRELPSLASYLETVWL
ncbi:MAG: sulfatase-like hydrolase/transferase [Lachnospiraceae bacterium]